MKKSTLYLGSSAAAIAIAIAFASVSSDAVKPSKEMVSESKAHASVEPDAAPLSRMTTQASLPPADHVAPAVVARSWSEWVKDLSESDRQIAEELHEKYPEAYAIESQEQLQWLVSKGYPTPEDYVAAKQRSFEELLDAGRNGDSKSALLAYERAVSDSIGAGLDALENDPRLASMRDRALNEVIGRTCSPFQFYVYARHYEHLSMQRPPAHREGAWVQVMAAYSVIDSMGDYRVRPGIQAIGSSVTNSSSASALAQSVLYLRDRAAPSCDATRMPSG